MKRGRARAVPVPSGTPGVHFDAGAPVFLNLGADRVRAYDILMRTTYPGVFWLACSLYLALSPPDARSRYILNLETLRRLGAIP